jgi:Na+/alanine symporter
LDIIGRLDYYAENKTEFIKRKKVNAMIRKVMMLFTLLMTSLISLAQEKVEMADTMRSNGRIYVVVAVALTILAGLILYVIRLDRKISRLEREK